MTVITKIILLLTLVLPNVHAQTKNIAENKQAQKQFEGLWINKHTSRCLEISFENGHANIIDWTAKLQKRESGDIYKAFLKNGKLVMPEDKQHQAPYSEILYKNNTLIYLSKSFAGTTDWNKEVFTRKSKK